MIFYFYLACFIFSIPYSVLPFPLVYVLHFIHLSLFFLMFFLKPLSSVIEELLYTWKWKCELLSHVQLDPMDCSPPGSTFHEDSPGKNTGVGCHFLLGDLPNPGIKPRSPALQAESLPTELQRKPTSNLIFVIPFRWHIIHNRFSCKS